MVLAHRPSGVHSGKDPACGTGSLSCMRVGAYCNRLCATRAKLTRNFMCKTIMVKCRKELIRSTGPTNPTAKMVTLLFYSLAFVAWQPRGQSDVTGPYQKTRIQDVILYTSQPKGREPNSLIPQETD